ncbi:hypothetical protein CDV31_005198 [Fusarium ambrosium]|uniref:DUF7580 domain-containing protein n=1 Tax=Fusarium ambrosium TaxID=131363 RepID=A0A428ULC8_9HYPO|nr:hypothetical protein CDV31_005198 [Fusarium ambrosium]
MSGFEVAGIVLGALPLLIEGAKATKFYLQGIERWWQFETDFEAFVRAITLEDVIFTQNLDLLLLPLDLSDNERNSLKASSKSSLWRHPDIVAQLKHHLREALPLFTRLLNELRISLDELHEMIPVKFFLEPKSQRRLQEAQTQTIEMFWSSSSMNLAARLQIGISIATVLLGVGTSAWVPRGWNWEDIFVMRSKEKGPGQDWMFGPYMDHKSLSLTLKEIPMNAKDHAEAAIFSLGVLLMELHFRQGLENSPHWHRHCPGGQPNDLTNIAAAYAWYQDLEKDPGLVEGLAEPVRRCIQVSFASPADLESADFIRDVLEAVVQPLEAFLKQWSGKMIQ